MNTAYLIYEAERPKTTAEQRRIDAAYGELSASVARAGALDGRARAQWSAHLRARTRRIREHVLRQAAAPSSTRR